MQLFVRDRRRVTLTISGKVLLREARIVLDQFQYAVDVTRRSRKAEAGIVRVGIAHGLSGSCAQPSGMWKRSNYGSAKRARSNHRGS